MDFGSVYSWPPGSGLNELDGHFLGTLDKGGELAAHVDGHLLDIRHPVGAQVLE